MTKIEVKNTISQVQTGEKPEEIIPESWLKNKERFSEIFDELMYDFFFEMGDTHFNRSGCRSASDKVYEHTMEIVKEKTNLNDDIEHYDMWW